MRLHALLLLLHILAATLWIGGMFFAHFCLRPAATALEPAQRLGLWRELFARFFPWVGAAVTVLLLTGFALAARIGFAALPPAWHAMAGLGVLMALVFASILTGPYRRFRHALDDHDLAAAAAAQGAIRRRVAANLGLGVLTIAAAILGPVS